MCNQKANIFCNFESSQVAVNLSNGKIHENSYHDALFGVDELNGRNKIRLAIEEYVNKWIWRHYSDVCISNFGYLVFEIYKCMICQELLFTEPALMKSGGDDTGKSPLDPFPQPSQ